MLPISAEFAARILRSHTRVTQVTVEDASGDPISVVTGEGGIVKDGKISISQADRKITLQITNPKGIYTPQDADALFWWTNRIRVERGILIGGYAELLPKGRYLVEEWEVDRTRAGSVLTLSGSGMLSKGSGSRFTEPVTYPDGTLVGDLISDILTQAGLGPDRGEWEDGGQAIGAPQTFDYNTDRIPAALKVARDFALDLDEDDDGLPTLTPAVDPSASVAVWSFAPGTTSTLLGLTKRVSRDGIRNHILVGGEFPWGDPIWAEVRDLDPTSPTYNPAPPASGPLGDLLLTYQSSMIYTQDQADAVAAELLRKSGLITEVLTMPVVANPALQVRDVVSIEEEEAGVDDLYLLDQIDLPLGKGAMTVQTRKVRSLSGD